LFKKLSLEIIAGYCAFLFLGMHNNQSAKLDVARLNGLERIPNYWYYCIIMFAQHPLGYEYTSDGSKP